MTQKQTTKQVTPQFTLEQLLWLEQVFPENTNPKATTDELYISLGARRVVKCIEANYNAAKQRNARGG